jgi:hypothetical protein
MFNTLTTDYFGELGEQVVFLPSCVSLFKCRWGGTYAAKFLKDRHVGGDQYKYMYNVMFCTLLGWFRSRTFSVTTSLS